MKLKRLLTLCCALSMALGMVTFVSAADYSFKTSPDPVYYGSTNYEDLYDAEYRYGSRNQVDYDIPEIQYGLSQEFLESSLNNPYLNGNTQYGFGVSSSNTQYPESDYGSSSIISGGGTIEMPYDPSVTLNDLKQSDGSIGQVSIDRVGLNCKVYEGATDSSMSKGAGHYLDDDGDSEICPCAFVMLMSDGKIEPFVFETDKDIERIANKGHTGFTGFVPTK